MRAHLTATCIVVATGALAAVVWACSDPVHDTRVDALGPEVANVSPGPTHRPGQPCLTCHGGGGPADTELTVAGTIYQTKDPISPPAVGATVTIFDGTQLADGGAPHSTVTNAAGNFFFRRSDWSPVYPLHDIAVSYPGLATPTMMHTTVGRDGACATCHFEPRGVDSHGHVYLVLEPTDLPGGAP